jgi:aerobic-type carbon monoxide dehydrogenase small subunit (CoxS/CutS family)
VAIAFTVNGRAVEVPDDGASLLEVLRDRLQLKSAKDGCSPQGQCGCCTVLVDGQPRVACVTPARRIHHRSVTTLEGLPARDSWADRFAACGASQCGFCTPGIIMRLAALPEPRTEDAVTGALRAHLCRCTGWRTIVDAATTDPALPQNSRILAGNGPKSLKNVATGPARRRAELEGHTPQHVGPDVSLGAGGFADDTAPPDALVAIPTDTGWAIGETLTEARANAQKVQGRRTTAGLTWPLDVPPGDWELTLRTTWVEPAYLEPDAAWCEPGGEPIGPLQNGGAFGGKVDSPVAAAAKDLANHHGRAVRVLYAREDVVKRGPKRPPVAAGINADGTGVMRVAATPGLPGNLQGLTVDAIDIKGPPTSLHIRGALWVEAAVLTAAVTNGPITSPAGGRAEAHGTDETIHVRVSAGDPLDATTLRSYCIGAAHQAFGWVTSEAIAVDQHGVPADLTIRSFGIVRAKDMPDVVVDIEEDDHRPPVNASDAVFAAVAAAVWRTEGLPPEWPTRRR